MICGEQDGLRSLLHKVERRLAVISGAFILSVVLLLVFGLVVPRARSQSQVVRARGFEIVDASGRLRILLDAVNNKPSLWFFDSAGRRRLGLTVSALDAPALVLSDDQGHSRIALSVGTERAAEVRLTDSNGRPRIGVWITNRNEPGVWLFDDLARARIGLKVLPGGDAKVWV
ncbi:MAG TPA: hypothetical protein VFH67_05900, partial [bacterium]|nr:hypothetical protein [bacterium]